MAIALPWYTLHGSSPCANRCRSASTSTSGRPSASAAVRSDVDTAWRSGRVVEGHVEAVDEDQGGELLPVGPHGERRVHAAGEEAGHAPAPRRPVGEAGRGVDGHRPQVEAPVVPVEGGDHLGDGGHRVEQPGRQRFGHPQPAAASHGRQEGQGQQQVAVPAPHGAAEGQGPRVVLGPTWTVSASPTRRPSGGHRRGAGHGVADRTRRTNDRWVSSSSASSRGSSVRRSRARRDQLVGEPGVGQQHRAAAGRSRTRSRSARPRARCARRSRAPPGPARGPRPPGRGSSVRRGSRSQSGRARLAEGHVRPRSPR